MIKTLLRICLFLIVVGLSLGSAQAVAASGVAGAGGWEILGQHTVKVGESLYCIGRAYGVDPAAIATQNDVANPSIIHPGEVLSIPDVPKTLPPGPVCTPQFGDIPEPPPESTCGGCNCRWTPVVRWGNTLSWLSLYYGADIWSIARCNCIRDLNYIRAGETLCIP